MVSVRVLVQPRSQTATEMNQEINQSKGKSLSQINGRGIKNLCKQKP
jgi:hypothetical protein